MAINPGAAKLKSWARHNPRMWLPINLPPKSKKGCQWAESTGRQTWHVFIARQRPHSGHIANTPCWLLLSFLPAIVLCVLVRNPHTTSARSHTRPLWVQVKLKPALHPSAHREKNIWRSCLGSTTVIQLWYTDKKK